jgi:hypothetical protein
MSSLLKFKRHHRLEEQRNQKDGVRFQYTALVSTTTGSDAGGTNLILLFEPPPKHTQHNAKGASSWRSLEKRKEF